MDTISFVNTEMDLSFRELNELDLQAMSELLGCDSKVVQVLMAVAMGGGAFLSDGRPEMLFEAHYFSNLTDHKFDYRFPDISVRDWNNRSYGAAGAHQYTRLVQAMALNKDAALRSCAWGMAGIMGDNFAECGAPSLDEFVRLNVRSARDQALYFVEFLKTHNLVEELNSAAWNSLSKVYNGSGHANGRYDKTLTKEWISVVYDYVEKLYDANNKKTVYTTAEFHRIQNMAMQALVNVSGWNEQNLVVDGYIGPMTKTVIKNLQIANSATPTGTLDYGTQLALGIA